MHPLVGALAVAVMVTILYLILGRVPNSGFVAGFLLIGIGIGLVVARYGRMGPFQGELGAPRFESDLCDRLRREVARAARFDRELTLAVVRARNGDPVNWSDQVREADEVVACRNGWHVLVLPETPKDGAEMLIERATLRVGCEIEAVLMDPSVTHYKPERLGEALLALMQNPAVLSDSPLLVHRDTDRLTSSAR